jgi:predicted phage-related endonuclease
LQEEAADLVEGKKQEIKSVLGDRVLVDCTGFRLYYKPVESTRFKSSALKKENPELYEKYAYKSVSRPFRIKSI